MRLISGLTALATLLACNAHLAAASAAYVLTFEPETANNKHKIALTGLSPSTARLVLAQRAGVEDFHSTHGLSDEEIDAVNTYGLRTNLFEGKSSRRRAFLLAPLHAEAEANPQLRMYSRFSISNPPSFTETTELFSDLLQQSKPDSALTRDYLYDETTFESALTDKPWFHIVENAASLIELSRKLSKEKVTVTAVLIPEGEREFTWGSYDAPQNSAILRKRQSAHRLQEEEPMSAGSGVIPEVHIFANSSNSSSNYTNNTPLSGILPTCYSSERSCVSSTRNCTGHGGCTLKYKDQSKQSEDKKVNGECWGCSCGTTKSNGVTTYWAGPACQKKDISVEFWLIALFTIGLLSLVGFAVGTIWNMGEEQLPSVIGAGVSGPTARK